MTNGLIQVEYVPQNELYLYSFAGMAELVDAPDSKSGSSRSGGSIPPPGTNLSHCVVTLKNPLLLVGFFLPDNNHLYNLPLNPLSPILHHIIRQANQL